MVLFTGCCLWCLRAEEMLLVTFTLTLGSDLGSKKCLVGSNTPITTLTKELHVLQTTWFTPETQQHLQTSISTLD